MNDRYWLKWGSAAWIEVTKPEYVQAERASGYINSTGQSNEPATASFESASGQVKGSTIYPGG